MQTLFVSKITAEASKERKVIIPGYNISDSCRFRMTSVGDEISHTFPFFVEELTEVAE